MSTPPDPQPPAGTPEPEKDTLQRPFDPAKFRPEKDSLGRWKNLNSGRKAKAGPTPAPAAGAQASGPTPAPADFSDVEKAAGPAGPAPEAARPADAVVMDDNSTADTVIGVIQTALVLIGDEEGVLSDAEKILLRRPLVRVLEKYDVGADVMPAEVDLALALAGLLITRLQKPKTATWFAKVKAWCIEMWFRGKGRALASAVHQHAGPAAGGAP